MMTAEHMSALEAVAGRTLTAPDVAAIEPLLAARNDVAIAAILSVGRMRLQSCEIGIGTILATLGASGGAFLDTLVETGEADRNAYWAMELIRQGRLDIGMPETRTQVQALAAANPDIAASVLALLVLGQVPDPVSYNAVSDALNAAEGRLTL